ncbi:Ank3, partial [Symbiodinium necroappetens]
MKGSSSPADASTRRVSGGFLQPRPQNEDEEVDAELQGCDCRTRKQGQRVRSPASASGGLPRACPEDCTPPRDAPDRQSRLPQLRAGALLLPNSTDREGTEGTEQLKKALKAWLLEAANPWLDPLKEATSRQGRRLAGGCPASSLLEAMSETDTCEITAVERADRGSNAGKDTGLLEFLTIGECSYVAFLIYGALLGSLSGMGPGTVAIIGIVLLCWPIAACKVCCRCCRKCCCSCCREGKEVRKIGNVKKIVILLLSLAGLGGMAALPMAGIMGDVKAGTAVANSADCASREFLRSALGDVTAIGSAASVPAGSSGGADPDPGSNSSRLLQG